ncbi:hypothetical protein O5D80_002647 [Batrachochytrium dendrobatidis]|nr:hypothetical protein O5D80_002647 [Batrachochytrium dendrobatidis]
MTAVLRTYKSKYDIMIANGLIENNFISNLLINNQQLQDPSCQYHSIWMEIRNRFKLLSINTVIQHYKADIDKLFDISLSPKKNGIQTRFAWNVNNNSLFVATSRLVSTDPHNTM